ncbi:transcription factor WhiB [Mycobacterium riyadhense]|uniref:4Fe-4S Wbl-type domain-containing protein n=2 Tax=Mycobacterium riyadhense TaxID=486698 RepID=A0A653EW67_9MYCO|nr:transcription factor WhiB [Mycobacterium riyadhense]VTP00952.1 hypothetical protein BIN_B_03814 [Mycobacterium riyadhense]
MTDAAAPSPCRTLPCQQDPQRWLERGHRRDALAGCLTCTARPWCAQEALTCRASWGMWAGVWIDGRHSAAVPYLQAIAANDAAPIDRALAAITPGRPRLAPAPLRRPSAPVPPRMLAAAVLARSCGNCEVLAQGCRYTFDRVVCRCGSEAARENRCPADLFAACAVCAEMVEGLDPQLATRLGYVVDTGRDPASVPFHWRGSRWVLLERDGWLTEMRQDAPSGAT